MFETFTVYRRLVAEHRARADRAPTPTLGRSLLRLARAYERLVEQAEHDQHSAAFDSQPFVASRTVLGELAARLDMTPPGRESVGIILDAAIALHAADCGSIRVLDPASDTFRIVAQRNFAAEFLATFAEVDASDDSVWGRALDAGAPVIVEDVLAERSLEPYRRVFGAAGVRAVQATPIVGPSGAVIGMLSTYFGRVHRPSALDMIAAEICAAHASDVLAEVFDYATGPSARVAT
jgi:GAF domain-containing protein